MPTSVQICVSNLVQVNNSHTRLYRSRTLLTSKLAYYNYLQTCMLMVCYWIQTRSCIEQSIDLHSLSKPFLKLLRRSCFKSLMSFSHHPPHHGVAGGINFRSMRFIVPYSTILSQSNSFRALYAPWKLVPLWVNMIDGQPRLEIHFLKLSTKMWLTPNARHDILHM